MIKAKQLLPLLSLTAAGAVAAERPNVIFIYFDDLGIGDVSHFNPNSQVLTPAFDSLAEAGMTLTDAHSPVAVSTPSRYGVMTGRYSFRSPLKYGVLNTFSPPLIRQDQTTMAEMFQSKGYVTGHVGKWHLGQEWQMKDGSDYRESYAKRVMPMQRRAMVDCGVDFTKPWIDGPNQHGFDHSVTVAHTIVDNGQVREPLHDGNPKFSKHDQAKLYPTITHVPEWVKQSTKFIKESAKGDKPFFLYYPLTCPHEPHVPTEQFVGKSGIGAYGDYLLECDWVVEQMMTALKKAGVDKNTLIILSSDNGPETSTLELKELGHHSAAQYRGHKRLNFEGGHRVPTIAYWPGVIEAGSVCNKTVSQIDLFATFAELIDYQIKDNEAVDSYSFLPALKGDESFERGAPLIQQSSLGYLALREGDWIFITTPAGFDLSKSPKDPAEGENVDTQPYQLYNVKADFNQRNNLYSAMPEKAAEMRATLKKFILDGRSTTGTKQPNDEPFAYDKPWDQISWVYE